MGYTTDFYGAFIFDKPLNNNHRAYLEAFAETRRMKRNGSIAEKLPDSVRVNAGLPIGRDGGYFVGKTENRGQNDDESIINYNKPPDGQPNLWCQWIPSDDGTQLEWDGGEKFYDYIEWLTYIIENFLKPWGYVLNGVVQWQGEDRHDIGEIAVDNNKISIREGKIVFE